MMVESRDKGIIQRVLDQIYEKFAKRKDLEQNCEIRISFLEIYKEQVTDLLEGHVPPKKKKMAAVHRHHNSSFAVNQDSAGKLERDNPT